jgi:hypothetical protein
VDCGRNQKIMCMREWQVDIKKTQYWLGILQGCQRKPACRTDTMPSKRKHEESDPKETVHASRQFQVYGSNPKPAKKPRRFEPPVYKKQAHASSVNAIKKRIRDVTRRLDRSESLPANVRIEDERALTAFQQELASAEAEKIRQKMIKKYHMVRFFGIRYPMHIHI